MYKKNIMIGIISLTIVIGIFWLVVPQKEESLFGGRSGGGQQEPSTYTKGDGTEYQAISTGPAFLDRIIIGETVASGTLSIDDAVSPSTGRVFNFGVGLTKGIYEIGLDFVNGIMATVSSTANPVFIYTPR